MSCRKLEVQGAPMQGQNVSCICLDLAQASVYNLKRWQHITPFGNEKLSQIPL